MIFYKSHSMWAEVFQRNSSCLSFSSIRFSNGQKLFLIHPAKLAVFGMHSLNLAVCHQLHFFAQRSKQPPQMIMWRMIPRDRSLSISMYSTWWLLLDHDESATAPLWCVIIRTETFKASVSTSLITFSPLLWGGGRSFLICGDTRCL